jgi:transposase-like protein
MSAAARTLSLIDLCDLSDDAAHKMLCGMRWPDNDGAPICPHCSCAAVYTYRCRRLFKCKACHRQFSATSGTSLACRKLPVRTLLMAFCLFVNAAKGISSLQFEPLSRAACEDRVRLAAQAAMRFDGERRDDPSERGR